MKRFTDLFTALDGSNRTTEKLALLKAYFTTAPHEDAAWALYFLIGKRLKRLVKTRDLRAWAGGLAGLPEWLVDAAYDQVGDLAETVALILPAGKPSTDEGQAPKLAELVGDLRGSLTGASPDVQRDVLSRLWRDLESSERFVLNKLLTGGFRVGVSRTTVSRALAEAVGLEPAIVAHRLMGKYEPTASNFATVIAPASSTTPPEQPYPFYLAYPVPSDGQSLADLLGPREAWQIEWKWDGIRAQLVKRKGVTLLWSRGEELVADQFPEIIESADYLPEGTVLDGELLAWEGAEPLSFGTLQKRLGRKSVGPTLRKKVPVAFVVYDLLEVEGADIRERSTLERRSALEGVVQAYGAAVASSGGVPLLRISPIVECGTWEAIAASRQSARENKVEGLMLKRKTGPYKTGRSKGDWWKWKVEPYTIDAVMVYAQQGHGRRAGLFTDYTFSIWDAGKLVPFAKAYSGLSDAEIRQVDRWIRAHTLEKHGPVSVVEVEQVFEIAFEGIAESKRHKSGIAVRFPRIKRWRRDKPAKEADSLASVKALLMP